jgi:hypothetical protein
VTWPATTRSSATELTTHGGEEVDVLDQVAVAEELLADTLARSLSQAK